MPLATASVGVREVTQAPALSAPGTIDGFPVELFTGDLLDRINKWEDVY